MGRRMTGDARKVQELTRAFAIDIASSECRLDDTRSRRLPEAGILFPGPSYPKRYKAIN
ncbi:hypothetical protein BSE24067_04246 [Burkholderia seminalis]|nr:hypothetical protein BSE24067_04246 [Burkholderia seminalis]